RGSIARHWVFWPIHLLGGRRQERRRLTGVLLEPRSTPDFSRFSSSRKIGRPKGSGPNKRGERTGRADQENFRQHNRNRSQRFRFGGAGGTNQASRPGKSERTA